MAATQGDQMRTSILKAVVIMTMALLTYSNAWANDAGKIDKAKEAAIQQYLKTVPIENMLDDAMNEFIKMVPVETRGTIKDTFKNLDRKKITDATIKSMRTHFTTNEIKALTKFYASPEGKSVMHKMAAMQAEVMPVIQTEVVESLRKVTESANPKK